MPRTFVSALPKASRLAQGLVLATFLAFGPVPAHAAGPVPTAGSGDQCFDCHDQKADRIHYDRHTLEEWKASVHAPSNAGCADCHGGDPKQTEVFKAHRDVLASSDPKSKIYYRNLPQTCGACHKTEYEAFKRSKHFKMLSREGKGPTCTTCHGAMSASVPDAAKLTETCALCHKKPDGATDSILILQQSQALLDAASAQMAAQGKAAETPERLALIKRSQDAQEKAVEDWHAFDLEKVRVDAKEAFTTSKQVFKELKSEKKAKGGQGGAH